MRQLEQMVNRLATQRDSGGAGAGGPGAGGPFEDVMVPDEPGVRAVPGAADIPGTGNVLASRGGGYGAPGQSFPPNPSPSNRWDSPATLDSRPGVFKFGPGFELRTNDDEYIFQFHNLTQFEYRGYEQGNQSLTHDTFAMPRQWFMFSGRISQPIGYFVSLAHGFDSVSMLDAFIDLTFDPRLSLRVGRYKTPFTYEFLVEPVQGLLLPERSLFFNNFGLNRDEGMMAYGRLWDGFFDYAAGIFNGTRNGYVANLDLKTMAAYINFRPFLNRKDSILENFDIGGSVFAGTSSNVPQPQTLRTTIAISGNSVAGIPFLGINNNVVEKGPRAFWDLHAAWFYKSLAVIAEWQGGHQNYALANLLSSRTNVPVGSYYVEAGYLLTGETRSSVGVVKPLHPFDLRAGQRGWGAWELVGRYNMLDVGSNVFTSGLADPNNWANRLWMTDFGFNWHMTQYLKFYFDWQHAEYNEPIIFAPNKRQLTSDTFIARLQLYF